MTGEEAFAALAELVPAPERPTRPDEIDWAAFERENGFPAPTDYRLLVEHYGIGSFGTSEDAGLGGWLYLFDPFHPEQSLLDQSGWQRENARGLQRQFPEQFPGWPVWPEKEGLLPWGDSIDGDLVGWWTTGVPDAWGTRFFGRGDDFEEFGFGIAEFIVGLFRGELGASSLDDRLGALGAENAPLFFPKDPDKHVPVQRPRQYVSVRFAGLTGGIDPASFPSSAPIFEASTGGETKARADEFWRLFHAATRPADAIAETWKAGDLPDGVDVTMFGTRSLGGDGPLHHYLDCNFEPALEEEAKCAVAELSRRLGVPIADARNIEHDRIWGDISEPE